MRLAAISILGLAACSSLLGIEDPRAGGGDDVAMKDAGADAAPAGRIQFGSAASYPAGASPQNVAIGDLDGDGVPDLCVGRPGAISLLYGVATARGTFSSPMSFAVGSGSGVPMISVRGCAFGDLNGDGKIDLAVSLDSQDPVFLIQNASMPRMFTQQPSGKISGGTNGVAVADIDHDGRDDLVFAQTSGLGVQYRVGSATAQDAVQSAPTGNNAADPVIADMNHDGHLDFIARSDQGLDIVHQSSQFPRDVEPVVHFASASTSFAVGDFDGDGFTDFAHVTIGAGALFTLYVERQQSATPGTFTSMMLGPAQGMGATAAGDFDHDGVADIATIVPNEHVAIYANGGHGFELSSIALPADFHELAAADLDGDGRADLVLTGGGGDSVTVLLAK